MKIELYIYILFLFIIIIMNKKDSDLLDIFSNHNIINIDIQQNEQFLNDLILNLKLKDTLQIINILDNMYDNEPIFNNIHSFDFITISEQYRNNIIINIKKNI